MAALTKDTRRIYKAKQRAGTVPLKASSTIYEGSAIGDDASGFGRALVAGDPFMGFAVQGDVGGAADGDEETPVLVEGIIRANIAGITEANLGDTVYMSSDNDFTLTAGGNSAIGKIDRVISTTVAEVFFQSDSRASR